MNKENQQLVDMLKTTNQILDAMAMARDELGDETYRAFVEKYARGYQRIMMTEVDGNEYQDNSS